MSATQNSSSGTKDGRTRNYACVVYPDSAPSDWLDIISEAKLPVFVSPLHDKDTNPTGEPKKPHYHVVVAYENKKTVDQARSFFESFGGVGCETVQSLRGYARYLCHLDNPEKVQYSSEDVRCFGGVDYASTIGLPTDKYKAIREMIEFCNDNEVESYAKLLEWASDNRFDWFRVLCDNGTVVMKEYLKSKTWENSKSYNCPPSAEKPSDGPKKVPDGFVKADDVDF